MQRAENKGGRRCVGLIVSTLMLGCAPDKPDILEARHQAARARADNVKQALATHTTTAPKVAQPDPALADVVAARVGDKVITLYDLAEHIAAQPAHLQPRYATPEQRAELLQRMIEFELMALEAHRLGLAQRPRVQLAWKRALARELLAAKTSELVTMASITDAEVRAWYDVHRDDYREAERRRAALLVVNDQETAERLASEVATAISEAPLKARQIFGDFVLRHTVDKPTGLVKGDLGWFDVAGEPDEGKPRPPDAAVEAAFAVAAVNELSAPFPLDRRWALVQLTNRREAVSRGFDEVALDVRNKLFKERQVAEREAYIKSLVDAASVEIDAAALAKLPGAQSQAPPEPPADQPKRGAGPASAVPSHLKLLERGKRRTTAIGRRPRVSVDPGISARVDPREVVDKIRQEKERLKREKAERERLEREGSGTSETEETGP